MATVVFPSKESLPVTISNSVDTDGIDIGFFIGEAASNLLRRRVVDRTDGIHSLGGRVGRCCPGYAEIGNLGYAVGGHENVLGFDIAVNDLSVVCLAQRTADLNGDIDSLAPLQAATLLDIFLKGDALHIFHDDIIKILILANVIYLNDMGWVRLAAASASVSNA
jgi:hypothetical protein